MAKKKKRVLHNHNVDTKTNEDRDQLFLTPGSKEYEDATADDPLNAFTVDAKHLLPPVLSGKSKKKKIASKVVQNLAKGVCLNAAGLPVTPLKLSELESAIDMKAVETEGYVPKALRKFQ